MNNLDTESTVDLRHYLAILKRRKWNVMLVAGLVLGATLYYSFRQVPVYTSQARLLIKAIQDPNSGFSQFLSAPTETEIVESEPVATAALDLLDAETSVEGLLSGVSVEQVPSTDVLTVSYTSTDPAFAASAANAFAEGYIRYRRDRALEELLSLQEAVTTQLREVLDRLADLSDRVDQASNAGNDALTRTREAQRTALITRVGILQQRSDDLNPTRTIRLGGGEVIQQASIPSSPSSPDHVRNGLLGGVLGFSLAITLALLRDNLDERFRSRRDVEAILGAPVLAMVPRFRTPKENAKPIILLEPGGSASEAYRTLRTNLQFVFKQRGINALLVTSPTPGEGKSVTALNLAIAMAQAHQTVTLVSGDLRRPTVERALGLSRDTGLSNWLLGEEEDLKAILQQSGIEGLQVVGSGPAPHNAAQLLASPRLAILLGELRSISDLVIIDSAPVLGLADAAVLATCTDAALLVLDASKTRRTASAHAKEELERVGTPVVGSVLNSYDPAAALYYGHSYDYLTPTPTGFLESRRPKKDVSNNPGG